MSDDELVTVLRVKDNNEAEVIKIALENEGIRCELGGEHQAGMTGVFDVEIMVKESDEDRARELIESHSNP